MHVCLSQNTLRVLAIINRSEPGEKVETLAYGILEDPGTKGYV